MILTLALVLAGSGLAWASVEYRRFHLWGRQIQNLVKGREYVHHVRTYHDTFGRFPESLAEAVPADLRSRYDGRDAWGRPFLYEPRGGSFLLVSQGRDGRADVVDWWWIRDPCYAVGTAPSVLTSICLAWDSDQVMSDLGEHRICGK